MSEELKRTCPACEKGQLTPAKVRIAIVGSPIGSYDGLRCNNCGEEFLRENSLKPAHKDIVSAGLFGIAKQRYAQTPAIPSPFLRVVTSGTANVMEGTWAELEFSGTSGGSQEYTSLRVTKNKTV